LLPEAPWDGLTPCFDLSVMIKEPKELVANRLVERWLSYGFDEATAHAKVQDNDLPNVDVVMKNSRRADVTITSFPSD
jgi:pantothenate kinase